MIGPLEIVILLLIILLVTGAYKKLPQLGRSAGKGARTLGEGAMEKGEQAKELAAGAKEKHGDSFDPHALVKKAGAGAREARELRDSFKGAGTSKPTEKTTAVEAPTPKPDTAPRPDPDADPQAEVTGGGKPA